MTTTITVEVPGRRYPVVVGRGVLGEVPARLPPDAGVALVVSQAPVRPYAERVVAAVRATGRDAVLALVDDGEGAKSAEVLSRLWTTAAEIPLRRRDVVVAVGGGVVGDLGGFLAATWNRGVAVVQVPTTLLAQVDAAIGGKTGINLPHGKNLVGAFHQPVAVVADVTTLSTLTPRLRIEGLGEVVKYGFIRDPGILDLLEGDPRAAREGDLDLLTELVERSVAVKAAVVTADEHETGERAHLNLGHTYGHAVEALTGYHQLLHGEAVAVGLLVALDAGARMGLTPPELPARCEALLTALGLPVGAPSLDRDTVWAVMARDKKATAGVNLVVLEALASPTVVAADRGAVDAAIDAAEQRGAR